MEVWREKGKVEKRVFEICRRTTTNTFYMTVEEFYKTQWTGDPEIQDHFWKCAPRFSYDDLIKFAQNYHSSHYEPAFKRDVY